MRLVYLLRSGRDDTLDTFISTHKDSNEVVLIDVREIKDPAGVVDLIESGDRVISW